MEILHQPVDLHRLAILVVFPLESTCCATLLPNPNPNPNALDELRVEDLDQLADRHLAGVGLLKLLDELLPDIASVLILPDLEGEGAGEVISDRGECAGVAPGPGLPPRNLMSGGGGGRACGRGGSRGTG